VKGHAHKDFLTEDISLVIMSLNDNASNGMANAQTSGNSHPMSSLGDIYGNTYLHERFRSFIFPHTEEPVYDSISKNNLENLSSSVALVPANPDSSPSSMKEVCSVSAKSKISVQVQQHKPIASSTHSDKISNDETEHVVKYTGPSLDYLSYFDKILPPSYQPEQSNFSMFHNLTSRADNTVLPVSSTVKNPYAKGASTTRTDETALPLSSTVKNPYAKGASTTRTDSSVLPLSSTVKNPYAKSASTTRTDKTDLPLSSTVKNPSAKSSSTTRTDNTVKKRKKVPQTPAALNTQENWKFLNVSDANEIKFENQNSFLDEFLTDRAIHFIKHFHQRIKDKLRVKGYEPSELNVFIILAQNGLDNILDNESMNLSSCPNVCTNEFHQFLGTLLLSSTFNLSMDHSFDLMEKLTGCSNVKLDHFREILHNIKRYGCSNRKEHRTSDQWSDQRNLLHNLHQLEQKLFERSTDLFFDCEYGWYVYDDELLASKATDVEL
jgi:hypothetical protein